MASEPTKLGMESSLGEYRTILKPSLRNFSRDFSTVSEDCPILLQMIGFLLFLNLSQLPLSQGWGCSALGALCIKKMTSAQSINSWWTFSLLHIRATSLKCWFS